MLNKKVLEFTIETDKKNKFYLQKQITIKSLRLKN